MRALHKVLGMIATGAGVLAGAALLGLMFTTVLDVTVRSTFNIAFLGVTEITELGLILVAVGGIAYCGWTDGHIALEFGERYVPPILWRAAQVLSAAIAGAVSYYSLLEAAAVHGRNAHTNLLQIPEYPFYVIVGLGFLTLALILLYKAATPRTVDAGTGPSG
jgi:TRAP-type C4-dicarboxylate transport system permease small subunit